MLGMRVLQRQAKRQAGGYAQAPDLAHPRPKVRGECAQGVRPCPYVGCRYHLFLEAKESGAVLFNFGADVETLHAMPETCALDVAQKDGATLQEVGELTNLTRERVRQIEDVALEKLKHVCATPDNPENQGKLLPARKASPPVMSPEKMQLAEAKRTRAVELLRQGATGAQVLEALRSEFGGGIGLSALRDLREFIADQDGSPRPRPKDTDKEPKLAPKHAPTKRLTEGVDSLCRALLAPMAEQGIESLRLSASGEIRVVRREVASWSLEP